MTTPPDGLTIRAAVLHELRAARRSRGGVRERAYIAERAALRVHPPLAGRRLRTDAEVEARCLELFAASSTRDMFTHLTGLEVTAGRQLRRSTFSAERTSVGLVGHVAIAKGHFTDFVILHELAHAASMLADGPSHGTGFAAAHVRLLGTHMSTADAAFLGDAYRVVGIAQAKIAGMRQGRLAEASSATTVAQNLARPPAAD